MKILNLTKAIVTVCVCACFLYGCASADVGGKNTAFQTKIKVRTK